MSAQEQHITTRSNDAYEANERLAERAEALRFVSRVPMFCECADPTCQALILIDLELRRDTRLYLTAPGHRLDGAEPISRDADREVQRI